MDNKQQRATQQKEEDDSVFRGRLNSVRSTFLHRVFDLYESEMMLLHFDGFAFHFGAKRPYEEIEEVDSLSLGIVYPLSSSVRQQISFQHTTKDGLVDRRYRDNPTTHRSKKYRVMLIDRSGTRTDFVVYDAPDNTYDGGVRSTVKKINVLLRNSGKMRLEDAWHDFRELFENSLRLVPELGTIEKRIRSSESVINACETLEKTNGHDGEIHQDALTDAIVQRELAVSVRERLRKDLATTEERMKGLVERLRNILTILNNTNTNTKIKSAAQ